MEQTTETTKKPTRLSNLAKDVQSGLTATLVSVPTSVAYAELAGVPGTNGLTRPGLSLVIVGMITGSKWLAFGATSLTAITTATDLDLKSYTPERMPEYYSILFMYSFMIGVVSIAMSLLGVGTLAQRIPASVMSGFKWGAAFIVFVAQTPGALFGRGKSEVETLVQESTWAPLIQSVPTPLSGLEGFLKMLWVYSNPHLFSISTAVVGVGAILFILNAKRVLPKALPQGFEVLLLCAMATLYSHYTNYQGSVIGYISAEENSLIPKLYWSSFPWEQAPNLLVKAIISSLVNFSAAIAICATFEQDDGVAWSPNRELLAQGVANIVAGLTGSQPIGGSLTRSLVTRLSGAATPFASIVNGLALMLLMPFLWIIAETPKAALAGIVLSQIIPQVLRPKALLKLTGVDAMLGWSTAIITAFVSPTVGIIAGCLLAGLLHFSGTHKKAN